MMKSIVFLVIIFTSISFAQFDEEMPRSAPRPLNPVTFEAIPYWTNDTTSIELLVLYRVSPMFLFFTKTDDTQQEAYEAKGELIVEILNDKDASIARDFRPIQVQRNSIPTEGAPPIEEIQGVFSFTLKIGLYRITIEAKDNESGKSFIDRNTKIDVQAFSPNGLNISPAIFVETQLSSTIVSESNKFIPMNRGNNVVIGQTGGYLLQIITFDTIAPIRVSWKISGKNEVDEDVQLNGEQFLEKIGAPIIIEDSRHITYSIKKESGHSRMIFAPIPLERLETGKYQFTTTLTQDTVKSIKEFSFNVIWPFKPRSLFDFKTAVQALRHIASEEEIDQMTAFSSDKSTKAFREFWRKRNPDTTRAFNPTMAEYYRRVDESIMRFSVSDERDGYRTDRGRIFILFGSPTITNRLLKPNSAPTEIWTYEKLKRRFTFTDQRKTGNYILVKTENY
jgi:GWxTD domain-containing protein